MKLRQIKNRLLDLLIKPSIVFESYPLFSDNTQAVYRELVVRGLEKRYRFVWWKTRNEVCELKHNGKIVSWDPHDRKSITGKIRNYSFYCKRKANIICNVFIPKAGEEKTFYLKHGSPLKRVKGYYSIPEDIDYIFSQAEAFNEISVKTNDVNPQKIITLGFPRNDAFSKPKRAIQELFTTDYKKLIVWYPTYRQKASGFKTGASHSIPLIYNLQTAIELNEVAKNNKVLIVIKPHFAQDVSQIKRLELSNLVFIDDSFFSENYISSYEFLNSSDALITDYSSVYYDYTLADKPIGVIWEDIEEYRHFPGFAVDLDYWMKGAEKIYTLQDLQRFILNVAEGKDLLQKERREIRDIANYSNDGKNTERVVDFIIEKAQL